MRYPEGFPWDTIHRPDHGRIMQALVAVHPLTLWIPASIIGLIVGLYH